MCRLIHYMVSSSRERVEDQQQQQQQQQQQEKTKDSFLDGEVHSMVVVSGNSEGDSAMSQVRTLLYKERFLPKALDASFCQKKSVARTYI